MAVPGIKRYDVVEVKFKGGRKEYYRNVHQLDLTTGDYVVCEMQSGYHIGAVSMQGELVRLQVKKRSVKINDDTKVIHRIATPKDMERHEQAILRDLPALYRSREIVRDLKLNMKLSDVEFQSDNTKATFYYSSEERVDFRELIKMLASEFKARIEMRQISLRQEAGRLGGIGSCGRELCCSTWLTDFKNIATSAARYQNLSLNPAKLSGQCGRLKCCLNYELDTYMDALRDIPAIDKPLETQKGRAWLQKTDIFRKLMWFGYNSESTWHCLPIPRVLEIVELNKRGVIPESFDVLTPIGEKEAVPIAALNSDLQKLDAKYATKSSSKKKKKKSKGGGGGNAKPAPNGTAT
ncbi:Signal peptidase-like protein [Spirosoma montaniterrae]|uniref:Signal peptidase-like protein n=1 Tax=Spirosoma montaniterrae TaxID=1178516 RepID=A0A1P9X4W2_9BACT|nr:Signal peptidase-like protein [Spirosoma montaniterrae]